MPVLTKGMGVMKLHPSLTAERIAEAVELGQTSLENPGFCIECGEDASECEPDARGYECESCGKRAVYGAEELLLMVV